ncbi:unnamed protein product [Lathyrus sativus]|nr:unnamed protein product [Lathyrus sativus]
MSVQCRTTTFRRLLQQNANHHHQRRQLSRTPALSVDHHHNVLVEENGYSRLALLNRPSALNAINTSMAARLHKLYTSWEDNPNIGFVMLKGSGRAFAAGGDIVALYRFINEGKMEACKEMTRTVYSFIYLLGTYLKPHVSTVFEGCQLFVLS